MTGVFRLHCQDEALEERLSGHAQTEYTGRLRHRLILVLDCLVDHEFSDNNADLINLQHYVIKEKKLTEKEAIIIFFDIVRVVEMLHEVRCHGRLPAWSLCVASKHNVPCCYYLNGIKTKPRYPFFLLLILQF